MLNDERDERIAIWNSFFKLAWLEAKAVYELAHGITISDVFDSTPPPLPDDQHHILAAVVLCNLAIEARANHLIEDLVEQGKISPEVGKASQRLSAKHKWFLIPTLAGEPNNLSFSKRPSSSGRSIARSQKRFSACQLCGSQETLPNSGGLLSFFSSFR